MQISLDKSQPLPSQKVKNILIRSFTKDRQDKNPKHPENSYILKYSPKYYRSLAIEIRPYSPLLSKIKKIKKLKRLEGQTGGFFKEILPQDLWFNLLANSRKDIEEFPQILPKNNTVLLRRYFWKRANLQKLKFFPNVTRLFLSKWRIFAIQNDSDPFISIKETFVQYLLNMKRLSALEIIVKGDNYDQTRWVFKKLDKMKRLLGGLETFIIKIEPQNENIRELFLNKNLFSHVTDLKISAPFDPILAEILQTCKKLNSLSLEFLGDTNGNPEFLDLLASIQHLSQLKSLEFSCPGDSRNFWSHFKPPTTLRSLELKTNTHNLVNEGLFGTDVEPKDVVQHWEEIPELDVLTLHLSCDQPEEMIFLKQFVTMILKKVRKVHSMRYYMAGPCVPVEPFFVDEVPHLYESLEKFGYLLASGSANPKSPRFDLKVMKPFRNLKELKLEGDNVIYDNVEEVVSVLQENQSSVLEMRVRYMFDQGWLGETLKKIDSVKKAEKNLEMLIDLRFKTEDLVGLLERLCQDIQAVKAIQGLVISLVILNDRDASPLPAERLRQILDEYGEVRNLRLVVHNFNGLLRYSKLDGEKELFQIHRLR